MATQIDRLHTIIMATGHTAYRRAMVTSSTAVKELGLSELVTSGTGTQLAATQQAAAVAAGEMATAESGATAATVGLGAAISPATLAIAALTTAVFLAVAAFAALTAATLVGAGGAAKGLIDVTKAARDAEDALRKAASVAALTEQEISALRDALPLKELARLGFDARDAGKALWYLISAGLEPMAAVEAEKSVSLLAAALNADLAPASEMLTSTMKALGIETKYASTVVDGFAAINAATLASFEKLQNALVYAAPTARMFGWSFHEMLVVLGQFSDIGLKGTQMGTAFRMGLIQLATGSDVAAGAFNRLGLSLDRAKSLISEPRKLLEYLSKAQWDAGSAAEVFGARAAGAWQQIIRAGVPEFDRLNELVHEQGLALKQSEINTAGLAGATRKLAADFFNMKAGVGEVNQALSIDIVKGASLAAQAFEEAFTDYINLLKESQCETLTARDVILETALAIVEGMGLAVEGSIILLEVWKKLAVAAEEVRLQWEFTKATVSPWGDPEAALQALRENEAGWKAAEDASEEYRKHAEEVLDRTKANVKRLREELDEVAAAPEPAAELAAKSVPILSGEEAMSAVLARQVNYRIDLARWIQEYKALSDSTLDNTRAEVAYRQRDWAAAQNILAVLNEEKATQDKIVEAVADEQRARISLLQAEQALRQYIQREEEQALQKAQRLQEKAWKEAERERMKAARDFQKISEEANKMQKEMQRVIGGDISRELSEAVSRLGGAGLAGRLSRSGALRATRMGDDLVVRIKMDGLTDEGRRAVSELILGDIEEGAREWPALTN